MAVSVFLPAEPVLSLPPALYDAARERYYRTTGARRDDAALPFRAADPSRVVRKITGVTQLLYEFNAPADDWFMPESYRPVEEPGRAVAVAAPLAVLRRGQTAAPASTRFVPDLSRAVYGIARPRTEQLVVQRVGAPTQQLYPKPIRPELAGAWARLVPDAEHGRTWGPPSAAPVAGAGKAPVDALEGPRTFAPHEVIGVYGERFPSVIVELPEGARLLVRDPHPWLPDDALPAAAPGTGYVFQVLQGAGLTRFRLVPARAAITYRAARTGIMFDEATGGWLVKNTEHESGNAFAKLERMGGPLGDVYREVGRTAAGRVAITVVAGAVSLGLGAAAAQSAIAAGSAASGSVAAGMGGVAGSQGTSTAILPGGQGVQTVGTSTAAPLNPLEGAAQLLTERLEVVQLGVDQVATEDVDRLYAEIAVRTQWLQGLGGITVRLFQFAAVMAQRPGVRDKLRIAIALEGQRATEQLSKALSPKGLAITLAVVEAIRTAVVASATLGAETAAEIAAQEALQAALDVAQQAMDAVQAIVGGLQQAALQRALEERIALAQFAAVQQLVAQFNAEQPAAVVAPTPTAEVSAESNTPTSPASVAVESRAGTALVVGALAIGAGVAAYFALRS